MLHEIIYMAAFVCIFIRNTVEIYRGECQKAAVFNLTARSSRLDAAIISVRKSSSIMMCLQSCLKERKCESFNYSPSTNHCELLSTRNDALMVAASGWDHYQPLQSEDRCRSPNGTEMCSEEQVCQEVCENRIKYKCRPLENIALGRASLQTTTCYNGSASRAVDGNAASSWYASSCTHSCAGLNNWWRVDFGKTATVHSVKITNRGDCCGDRLSDFNIIIGDMAEVESAGNTACARNQGIVQGATKIFACRPRLNGRYLYVQQNSVSVDLTLCEVAVFGEFI